jgi:ribonuclease E
MASIPTQEEVLAATRKSQEAMMAAVKTWLDTVRTAAPKLPSKLPQVSLPFTGKLPTPQDAVANAYHLAEQLLASQRKFAEDLVKATAPLRPGYRESSPEVPSRSAWQDAVTDSEPKTPAVSAAPKAVTSTEPKAADRTAPARLAAKSTPARTTTRTTAAERTTAAKRATARKGAGTTSPAPKGTDAS